MIPSALGTQNSRPGQGISRHVDPLQSSHRPPDPEKAAQQALEVCSAVASMAGIEHVSVNEADSTGFALVRVDAGTVGSVVQCFKY
ncbi:hypothetical protein GCM10025784_02610 [Citricoccus nitrophenolicus]